MKMRKTKMMVKVTAPSNIALIKYMGKEAENIPSNSSLSYSLGNLITSLEITESGSGSDEWSPLESDYPISLSEKGKKRYLDFFAKLKKHFGLEGSFLIRSANNFPSDCGLASSASSFAALTLGAYELAKMQLSSEAIKPLGFSGELVEDLEELSKLSRQGSGSSCRSLFSEWSVWEREGASSRTYPHFENLKHMAVIAEEDKKDVSSSEAHQRVKSSLLMEGRTKRAEKRINDLELAFAEKDWTAAYQICWSEFWDMHALFESSEPSFGYMNADSLAILKECREYWNAHNDGPIVTMDAGPNVHLLFRKDQDQAYRDFEKIFSSKYKIWGSEVSG